MASLRIRHEPSLSSNRMSHLFLAGSSGKVVTQHSFAGKLWLGNQADRVSWCPGKRSQGACLLSSWGKVGWKLYPGLAHCGLGPCVALRAVLFRGSVSVFRDVAVWLQCVRSEVTDPVQTPVSRLHTLLTPGTLCCHWVSLWGTRRAVSSLYV